MAVSLGPLAAGLGKGYSSPAIASLQELQIKTHGNFTSFTISDQQSSWIASLSLLGKYYCIHRNRNSIFFFGKMKRIEINGEYFSIYLGHNTNTGALFGAILGGSFLQYGRRRLLTIMSLPFSLSWILTVFARSVETMCVTAFFGGFCCSIVSMVTQVCVFAFFFSNHAIQTRRLNVHNNSYQ